MKIGIVHGEPFVTDILGGPSSGGPSRVVNDMGDPNPYKHMVLDAMGNDDVCYNDRVCSPDVIEEPPNVEASKFFKLLKAAEEPLWEGCTKQSKLSASVQLLNMKSNLNLTQNAFNKFSEFAKSCMPDDANLVSNFYEAKKFMRPLGLGYDKYDVCPNYFEELPPFPRRTGLQMLDEVSKFTDGHVHSSCDKIPGFGVYHNWVKKSIFWELPYWHTNVLRHNLDVMHIEKNCFDNIFYRVMDCPDRSKDNVKARLDIELYCRRPNLHLQQHDNGRVYKPKGSYYLFKKQQQEVLSWMKELSFPDGYASNISRCVKEAQCKVSGMKSHDCHVFIQRLIPVAFRPYLPRPLWETLTELSVFFRDICATNLNVNHVELMQRNIIEILCKLEKIFPPSFFDSMEHLTIHLPYEAQSLEDPFNIDGCIHLNGMISYNAMSSRVEDRTTTIYRSPN
ncbi:hypothetical protein OIU78_029763 [Salix suchowensis]|nr:hypothetical protein OIU78_029763 [Salix suchowensis]